MGTHIDNQALEKIPFGVLVFDSRDYNHILFASRRAAQVWDCRDAEELLAYWHAGLSHGIYPGDMDRVFQDISQVSDGEKNELQSTFRILTRKGAMRFVHMSGRREVQDGLIYACVTVHNAEEFDVDMLTGLPGPMQFSSRVEALCQKGENGKEAGKYAVLARLSEDQFLAIIRFRKRDEISEWMEKIKETVWHIHEVDHISITVQAECRGAPFSEQGVEIMWQAIMEGIKRFSADRAEQTLRP